MAEQQVQAPQPKVEPARKAETPSTPAAIARRVALKALSLSMAESMEGGGEEVNAGMERQGKAQRSAADVAQEGFSGSGQEVPHRAAMEKSFGVSFAGVKAYTDAPATKATGELGAHAYAAGNQVAFASANPSPALVAHELTHVLQHTGRGPVQAKATGPGDGGIDTSGEEEAERVEAAVGAGKSAKSALGGDGGGGGEAPAAKRGGEEEEVAAKRDGAGPALKSGAPRAPALDSKFATGMTFSPEGFTKDYSWELWKPSRPINFPIVAVPGLNATIRPSVVIKADPGANWKKKEFTAGLNVEGAVLFGLSYGNSALAEVYGGFEAKARGGFNYTKSNTSWSLSGGITLSTAFKIGVQLGGGILDYNFEFGVCEIGRLTGVQWTNGRFDSGALGWQWGPKPKEFFEGLKAAIAKAKRLLALAKEAKEAAVRKAKQAGKAVYNTGRDVVKWASSW